MYEKSAPNPRSLNERSFILHRSLLLNEKHRKDIKKKHFLKNTYHFPAI